MRNRHCQRFNSLLSEDRKREAIALRRFLLAWGELPGVTQTPSDISKSISRSPDGAISLRSDTARLYGPPGAQHHYNCHASWPG